MFNAAKRETVIDPDQRRRRFGKPLHQPFGDASPLPIFARRWWRRDLDRQRIALGQIDTQAWQAHGRRLRARIIDPDIAFEVGQSEIFVAALERHRPSRSSGLDCVISKLPCQNARRWKHPRSAAARKGSGRCRAAAWPGAPPRFLGLHMRVTAAVRSRTTVRPRWSMVGKVGWPRG